MVYMLLHHRKIKIHITVQYSMEDFKLASAIHTETSIINKCVNYCSVSAKCDAIII